MGNSNGVAILRREYVDSFLEEKLELDPSAIVDVHGKLHLVDNLTCILIFAY
jgi:hypothetical protein